MHISTLGYAILSLLARASLSGYDIAREMKRPHAFFFGQAQTSQIYPELARLQEAGLISSTHVEQQGKPDRRVYALTPAGMQRLRSWLTEPTPIMEARSELLIKAHSLWLADPAEALARFAEHERYHAQQLEVYETQVAELEQQWGPELAVLDSPRLGDYLTLMRGVGYEREYVHWLRWVTMILEQRAQRDAEGRGGRGGESWN
jgi:DNA-binding PadR family transcriptional regulator